ncbi:MAG: hypothetical protein ACK4RV_11600 [Caulobacter sp.]
MSYTKKTKKNRVLPPFPYTIAMETAWLVVAGLAFAGCLLTAVGFFGNLESGAGWLALICAPLAALVPLTVGVALRRSARIEHFLEQLATREPANDQ